MRRTGVALGMLALATVALAGYGRPRMVLRVSTHSGPMPLVLTLTGTVGSGAALDPEEFVDCVITVDYHYVTPAGSPLISKEEIPCREAADQVKTPATLKKELTLKDPGEYSYRIVLVRKDGKRMASTSQDVKVYRGKVEAGATKTTD
jgi:hypothetical protein